MREIPRRTCFHTIIKVITLRQAKRNVLLSHHLIHLSYFILLLLDECHTFVWCEFGPVLATCSVPLVLLTKYGVFLLFVLA